VQVFLQGKLLGIESFIEGASSDLASLAGRCFYVSLLTEAIPRALLTHLGLSVDLLGASGGGHFLTVLTSESVPQANAFLVDVTRRLSAFTGHRLRLVWSSTENLGAWVDVRKRIDDGLNRWRGAWAIDSTGLFDPYPLQPADEEFYRALSKGMPGTASAVWDPEAPGMLRHDGEPHWLATHMAHGAHGAATTRELAARAKGRKAWGVLRGDADQFSARLRKAQNVEEYLQFSVFFRQFFIGEVQNLCTQPEFRKRTSVLYTGGDEFAILGCWDSLIPFAREIARLFELSVEGFLREFPGAEGKTLSMAIALAAAPDSDAVGVYSEAGRQLEIAKSAGRECISVLGRVLDWKQLTEAAELRNTMLRLVNDFGCSAQFLGELSSFYRETDRTPGPRGRRPAEAQHRPWRLHRRLNRVLDGPERNKEFQKARNSVLAAFLTRGQAQLKLKPSGRVALDWARITEEAE